MRVGAGVAAVLAMLAVVAAGATAAPTRRCADDNAARCGSVSVPLLRGSPGEGGTLRVRFRVLPRTDRSRAALEPIVAVEGGPGYPSIESADSYLFVRGTLAGRAVRLSMPAP